MHLTTVLEKKISGALVLHKVMENAIKRTNVSQEYSVLNENRQLSDNLYLKFQAISDSWLLRSNTRTHISH